MNELKKMQKIHQSAIRGEILTAEEKTSLESWYQILDGEENLILNDSEPVTKSEDLREYLADATKQSTKISREIENLVSQNAALRNENHSLKKLLEERLLERAA